MLSRRESDIQVSCSRRVASSWKKSWCCQPLEAAGHGLQGCCSFRVHEDKVLMRTGNAIEYETVWDIGLCDEIITISLVSIFHSYLWLSLSWLWSSLVQVFAVVVVKLAACCCSFAILRSITRIWPTTCCVSPNFFSRIANNCEPIWGPPHPKNHWRKEMNSWSTLMGLQHRGDFFGQGARKKLHNAIQGLF